jgi:RNase P/RNase MRP subunit POP5
MRVRFLALRKKRGRHEGILQCWVVYVYQCRFCLICIYRQMATEVEMHVLDGFLPTYMH